jgi:hypothetical protein
MGIDALVKRIREEQTRRGVDPNELTERGLSALAAARNGATLYVFRSGKWEIAGPRELAKAERLARTSPSALTNYATKRTRTTRARVRLPYQPATYAGYRPPIEYRYVQLPSGEWTVYGDAVKISPLFKRQTDALMWMSEHEKLSLEMQRAHIAGMRR